MMHDHSRGRASYLGRRLSRWVAREVVPAAWTRWLLLLRYTESTVACIVPCGTTVWHRTIPREAAEAMGEPDTESWLEASRSYATLRRRYWRCFFGMPVSLIVYLVIGLPLSLLGEALKMNPYVTYLLLSSFSIVWCTCWVGTLVTWFRLIGFRCPRCGNRFILTWWITWPMNQCRHCDLDLGPSAMVKAKPLAAADLRE